MPTHASRWRKRVLLRLWRDVPFPRFLRGLFLRVINPSFMVGAMALIRDDQGRILILEHTYRREYPWGLPGGWIKRAERLEIGLAREVFEETGLYVRVDQLLGASFWGGSQLDLMYSCTVISGSVTPSDEAAGHRWADPADLPALLPNQAALMRKVRLF